jgi:hypothetical protein
MHCLQALFKNVPSLKLLVLDSGAHQLKASPAQIADMRDVLNAAASDPLVGDTPSSSGAEDDPVSQPQLTQHLREVCGSQREVKPFVLQGRLFL